VNPGSKFRTKLAQEKEKKTPHCDDTTTATATSATKKQKQTNKQTNKANATRIKRSFFVFPSFHLPSFELQQIADPYTKSRNF